MMMHGLTNFKQTRIPQGVLMFCTFQAMNVDERKDV
jgi:hypothetical protein